MKTTIKKIIKGTLAILAIKLLVVLGIFLFQSCQSEDISDIRNNTATSEFKSALEESTKRLSRIKTIRPSRLDKSESQEYHYRDNEVESDSICFKDFDHSTAASIDDIVLIINDIGSLSEAKNNHQLIIANLNDESDNSDDDSTDSNDPDQEMENCLATIEIPTGPILEALEPVTNSALDFFYNNGFNENDIIEMLDGEDPSTLIPVVMLAINADNNNQVATSNFSSIFGQNIYAQGDTTSTANMVRTCFMEATGIAAGVALVAALTAQTMDKQLVKKLVKKVVKKVGAKVLGGIGLALIIIDFSYCMATFQDA